MTRPSSRKGASFGGQVLKTRSRTSLWKQASLEMDKGWPYTSGSTQGHAKGVLAKGVLLKGAFEPVSILEVRKSGFPGYWSSRILNWFKILELQYPGNPLLWTSSMETGSSAPFNKTPFAKTAFAGPWTIPPCLC